MEGAARNGRVAVEGHRVQVLVEGGETGLKCNLSGENGESDGAAERIKLSWSFSGWTRMEQR